MVAKICSETGESRASLDMYDMQYLLSLYEYISFEEHVEYLRKKEENKANQQEQQPKSAGQAMAAAMSRRR